MWFGGPSVVQIYPSAPESVGYNGSSLGDCPIYIRALLNPIEHRECTDGTGFTNANLFHLCTFRGAVLLDPSWLRTSVVDQRRHNYI